MEYFLDSVLTNPFYYLSLVFAFVAALGLIMFFAGFFSGLPHVFNYRMHEGHLNHARTRAVWGVYLLAATFVVWEVVRWLVS